MKRHSLWLLSFLSVALAVTPQGPAPKPNAKSLASLMPAGPLLYLESPDFASLVHDWNTSSAKELWLKSDNYQVFSRSRLYLRLQEAQGQFASAAGFPPDMSLAESVAGGESVLALYDIGNLEFLYITRMPEARAMENALWRGRDKFEPRKAGDFPYYVRSEPAKNRLVAFATAQDFLLLATREDLLAGALTLISGKTLPTLKDEKWFDGAVRSAGPSGDLRMALHLAAILKVPHFRSYWVQRNVGELRQFGAEVADIHRSSGQIREERVLLRSAPSEPAAQSASAGEAALADVLRLVPDGCGLYRAWSEPTVESALDLLERKVLAPRVGRGVASQYAPSVVLAHGQVGDEGDLETRIDVPPLASAGGAFAPDALRKLLASARLEASLQLDSTRPLPGDVFVGTQSAILLKASHDWDAEAARSALSAAVEGLWTTSRLGSIWVERHDGEVTFYELDGLAHLTMAAHGPYLIVATGREPILAVLKRISSSAAQDGGAYAAGFRHATERQNLVNMMRLIETPFAQRFGGTGGLGGREPLFFSENLASLSQSLARVESESMVVHERGSVVLQTVIYRLSR